METKNLNEMNLDYFEEIQYFDDLEIPTVTIKSRPLIKKFKRKESPISDSAKRLLDLTIAISACVFLLPFFVAVSLAIWLNDGGSPIFAHERVGFNGKKFKCLKFRSMISNSQEVLEKLLAEDPIAAAEWEKDHKLRNDPRITKVGDFLRKTSLDELPQLINVIRNEMSIVGPRPITDKEVVKYGNLFHYYTSVKPGITGLWQVSGRNDTTYDERVELDQSYALNNNVIQDIGIILKTVPAVLNSRGAY